MFENLNKTYLKFFCCLISNKFKFGNNVNHHRTAVVLRLLDQTEVSSRADRLSACRAILYIAQVRRMNNSRAANVFANKIRKVGGQKV